MVSIVVPTLNEALQISQTLAVLKRLKGEKEIFVVDGGSDDGTIQLARDQNVTVLESKPGRGVQLHVGALHARGEILWFVHADTLPPEHAIEEIVSAASNPSVAGGNFGLIFDGGSRAARRLTTIYPILRPINLCYGDSGIFVKRDAYEKAGGFRPFALFEDLDLVSRLRKTGKFVHLECRIVTSSRRFEKRNFAAMWMHWTALQLLFWMGVPPNLLSRLYRNNTGKSRVNNRLH